MGHGRALLPLSNEQQFEVGNQVVQKSLSVRQTEELVKRVLNPKPAISNTIEPHIKIHINWRSALASSSGVSASRWIFSIRPIAKATWSLISRTMTGTVVSPAILITQ
jgi:ParB-like chromosome segregation protein Spo0J